MKPVLFVLFGWPVPAFGVMLALAASVSLGWAARRAQQRGLEAELFLNSMVGVLLAALLGARLGYFWFFPQRFWAHPLESLLSPGGLVWYTGMLGAMAALMFATKACRVGFWPLASILAVPASLGLALGRLGCLLAGCCYGGPCHLPWAITYPEGHPTHAWGLAAVAVHPSPLYESLGALALMAALLWVERRQGPQTNSAALFLVGYGALRCLLECFRGDRLVWALGLSASQWIGLGMIALGLGALMAARGAGGVKKACFPPSEKQAHGVSSGLILFL
jgi:phosphatidylglycerol:prolipoprotein diacylglycerol transferase